MHVVLFCVTLIVIHYLGLILHEFGHLVCARIVGWKPTRLCIGLGHTLGTWHAGDLKITFGSRFTSGMVTALASGRAGFRTKSFLVAAAGPLLTAWVAFGLFQLLDDRHFLAKFEGLETTVTMACLLEAWLLVINLWPHMVQIGDRLIPNDGLAMWRALSSSPAQADRNFAAHLYACADWLLERGEVTEASATMEQALTLSGQSALIGRVLLMAWLFQNRREAEAYAEWDGLEKQDRVGDDGRVEILDWLACLPLYYGAVRALPRARAAIEEAVRLAPDQVTLLGTKGALLVEADEVEDGQRMLEDVLARSQSESDVGICVYYLALARLKKGEEAEAVRCWNEAKAKYPQSQVAARVQKAFAEVRAARRRASS